MREIKHSALVARPPGRLFDLINDIESYPRFIPWCTRASVLSRSEREIVATIGVQRGPLHSEFTTRNELEQDRRILMHLVDGPFKMLEGEWLLIPIAQAVPVRVAGAVSGDVAGRVTGDVAGSVTGDVAGSLTGDVAGSLTGDVAGSLTGDVGGSRGGVAGNRGGLAGSLRGVAGSRTGDAEQQPSALNEGVGCRVQLTMKFAFKNPLTAVLFEQKFAETASSLVDAFVARARALPS